MFAHLNVRVCLRFSCIKWMEVKIVLLAKKMALVWMHLSLTLVFKFRTGSLRSPQTLGCIQALHLSLGSANPLMKMIVDWTFASPTIMQGMVAVLHCWIHSAAFVSCFTVCVVQQHIFLVAVCLLFKLLVESLGNFYIRICSLNVRWPNIAFTQVFWQVNNRYIIPHYESLLFLIKKLNIR